MHPHLLLSSLLLFGAPAAGLDETDGSNRWPSFRGERALGVADGQGLPERWDPATGLNVRWSVELPGLGHSSPVVWGERCFVTTAVPEGSTAPGPLLGDTGGIEMADADRVHRWLVLAFDVGSGELSWTTEAARGVPRAPHHVKASQANATPATDGETVVATLGSEGLFALDAATGALRWRVDLGVNDPGLFEDPSSHWGAASSPVIWRDRVIQQVDRHAGSFLAAYRLADGAELWRVERDEMPVWATPTLHSIDGRDELIVVGGRTVRGIDPATGEERWRFADFAEVKTPTPLVADGRIVLSGGYRGRPLFALRPGGRGDLTVPFEEAPRGHLLWATARGGPYTSTPLAYRGLLYSVRNTGILSVHDLGSGERLTRVRLDDTYSASPVASDGRLYLAGENGSVTVLDAGRDPQVLAEIEMGEPILATPAIAGGALYLRTASTLHAVADAPAVTRAPAGDAELGRARELLAATRDALAPIDDLVLEGEGTQDLAVRYQGLRPVPGGGRKPYRETFVVDRARGRLGWDVESVRPDDSVETLRFAYLGDDQMRFFHRVDGLAAWPRDPSFGATRRRLERRLPRLALEDALAAGSTIRSSAPRTLPDGSRARRIEVELEGGDRVALFVGESSEGAPRLRAISSAVELPIRGDTEVVWLFDEERTIEGLGRFPGGYTVWVGEEPLRRVEYVAIRRGAATSEVFGPPAGLEMPPPPPPSAATAAAASAADSAEPAPPRTRELAPGVHLVQALRGGFHALVVDLGTELLVVDAPTGWLELDEIPPRRPERPVVRGLAEDLLAAARRAAPGKPVRWLALTHFHADHAGGFLPFVEAGATVVASAPTLSLLRQVAERELDDPSDLRVREVAGRETIEGTVRAVELIEAAGNPHAAGLLVVRLPQDETLWVADLARPAPDGSPAPPSERHLAEWLGGWLGELGLRPRTLLAPHMSAIGRQEHIEALLGTGDPAGGGGR